jgi:UDP-GlcNAc:undecaprenyl-phosphate GlcNAc-1-phosphate transferase
MWLWAALIAFGSVFASLYAGPGVWAVLTLCLAATLVLTFLLPKLNHQP